MAEIVVVRALPAHIEPVASRMRDADRAEVWAGSRRTPADALAFSLERSEYALTVMIEGRPEAMFGVGTLSILGRVGAPWLLGTDAAAADRRAFLEASLEWRAELLARYDRLLNVVDVRNRTSIRWLRWLGATFSDPRPLGRGGELFQVFEIRAPHV